MVPFIKITCADPKSLPKVKGSLLFVGECPIADVDRGV